MTQHLEPRDLAACMVFHDWLTELMEEASCTWDGANDIVTTIGNPLL
jgi:hypothetical protein